MDDRRKHPRDKVIISAVASKDQKAKECVVRDISEDGARVQFPLGHRPIKDQMSLTIERDGRPVSADIIWSRGNVVGVSFNEARADEAPASDLDARVRKSEAKKRELQMEIQRLLGK
ncbi:PilZ domain-containing protein [Rhodopseudomonas boonkerdii]|uniref:PilZ domain-containing protein n=1 Tax=Rhodopseudomonas boonkerdii TaxID=475937 RepID=UPI001E36435A|nr:PilZ domain-containing protein [Rhodopseudomonas boonkerdii]UGV27137.1 PilZ domain-containing protein [Rhodopseudomonas boonkerdii]